MALKVGDGSSVKQTTSRTQSVKQSKVEQVCSHQPTVGCHGKCQARCLTKRELSEGLECLDWEAAKHNLCFHALLQCEALAVLSVLRVLAVLTYCKLSCLA